MNDDKNDGAIVYDSHGSPIGKTKGFAQMDRDRVSAIASLGGKAAHAKGTAHVWTAEEAREAGRKGGVATRRKRREAVSEARDPKRGE